MSRKKVPMKTVSTPVYITDATLEGITGVFSISADTLGCEVKDLYLGIEIEERYGSSSVNTFVYGHVPKTPEEITAEKEQLKAAQEYRKELAQRQLAQIRKEFPDLE